MKLSWLTPLFVLTLLTATELFAARAIPAHSSLVVDEAKLLDPRAEESLRAALTRFQTTRGPQIQLLTIPSLEGDSLEEYSIRVVDEWKLGKRGKDDGVLFLVVPGDRAMRIEVGRGLEGDLPDAIAGRIQDQGVKPYFREGRYAEGIFQGLNLIAVQLGGNLEGVSVAPRHQRGSPGIPIWVILIFLFFVFGGRRRRGGAGHFLLGAALGGLGGGRSSGGFGGGFSGGGGGGFSGGGASSRW